MNNWGVLYDGKANVWPWRAVEVTSYIAPDQLPRRTLVLERWPGVVWSVPVDPEGEPRMGDWLDITACVRPLDSSPPVVQTRS